MADPITLVSVDLDDVACYHAIHGLDPPDDSASGIVLERCLPRFLELFSAVGVKSTFFVIGRDLDRDLGGEGLGAEHLRQALSAGHELGNHSYAHAYDLVRWPDDRIAEDLRRCDALLRELGAAPTGFRAPGYTHDARLLSHVKRLGYRYDSSALPSLPYYLAKLAIMTLKWVRGRRSASLARGLGSFLGPRAPHRLGDGLWELPISVTPVLRLPLIGTAVLGSSGLARRLRGSAIAAGHFHLELHGLDLADPETDGLSPQLCRLQPELRSPLLQRQQRLTELLRARPPARALAEALGVLETDAAPALRGGG